MRVEQRDPEFSEFVAARGSALRRMAFLVCGDQNAAEDLLQTAVLKLYLAWPKIRSRPSPEAYARTTSAAAPSTGTVVWEGSWDDFGMMAAECLTSLEQATAAESSRRDPGGRHPWVGFEARALRALTPQPTTTRTRWLRCERSEPRNQPTAERIDLRAAGWRAWPRQARQPNPRRTT